MSGTPEAPQFSEPVIGTTPAVSYASSLLSTSATVTGIAPRSSGRIVLVLDLHGSLTTSLGLPTLELLGVFTPDVSTQPIHSASSCTPRPSRLGRCGGLFQYRVAAHPRAELHDLERCGSLAAPYRERRASAAARRYRSVLRRPAGCLAVLAAARRQASNGSSRANHSLNVRMHSRLQAGMFLAVAGGRLETMGELQHGPVRPARPDDLQAQRQAIGGEPGRH